MGYNENVATSDSYRSQLHIRPISRGVSTGGVQGAQAPPLISRVVIFQPIIVHTINPPFSDMLVPAPSTPKYIPLSI